MRYTRCMSRTTIAVSTATREGLNAAMAQMGTASLDATVRSLLFEHECNTVLAELSPDPEDLADAEAWVEADMRVPE